MRETELTTARTAFVRVMADPTTADLWQLQKALLVIGGEPAARARAVARTFHGCLRALESKSASRSASRWGAALGTAAVASVSIDELADTADDPLHNLLQSGVPALLEVGSALKLAHAWEIEAGLIYDDLAWFLFDELWDASATARPDLSPAERRDQIDRVLSPLLDPAVPDGDRAGLAVHVFQAALAARMARVVEEVAPDARPATGQAVAAGPRLRPDGGAAGGGRATPSTTRRTGPDLPH